MKTFPSATKAPVSQAVLRGISLEINRGEIVALVGSSGAGKSSLAALIPRFFDVTSGLISIDGQDIREVTLASLRSQIAIVTQDTFLFKRYREVKYRLRKRGLHSGGYC